ncbi:hypothetical protein [Mucilaginibacter sp.]|uniref:hypothetical protein n=1 Tax=Mucilaginibacter sp. TaxID=1882438 RepID=UPI0026291B1F|nr:hypothetical protein [Mucilaginibacter sp.]MDB4921239.1 hypothetical protein [Mucilaginibacter sp.]
MAFKWISKLFVFNNNLVADRFMLKINDVLLVNKFPDFNVKGFDSEAYNVNFKHSNIVNSRQQFPKI